MDLARSTRSVQLAGALLLGVVLAVAPLRAQQPPPPLKGAATPPADARPVSISLEDLPYPHPVSYLPLTVYGQDVRMAYMDVPPSGTPNGRTCAPSPTTSGIA